MSKLQIHEFSCVREFREFKTKHKGLKKVQRSIWEIVCSVQIFFGSIEPIEKIFLTFPNQRDNKHLKVDKMLTKKTKGGFKKVYIMVVSHCVYVIMNGENIASLSLMTESLDLNGNPGAIAVHPCKRIK